ncbi:MAG: hypothetical protein WCC17_21275 [Candidatus Nitrosopolaris sp.]
MQSNGHIENTTKEDNEFELGINEPHEGVPVVDDEQLRALPENEEEEKEEILLPSTTAAKTTKPKVSSSKGKSSSQKRRRDEPSSADTTKQLERQATQLMLHSVQKDMKSTKGQSKLINQLHSQIMQLRTQMSQIQKNTAKRNFTTATISSRKKMLRPKKR